MAGLGIGAVESGVERGADGVDESEGTSEVDELSFRGVYGCAGTRGFASVARTESDPGSFETDAFNSRAGALSHKSGAFSI
ncbi:hypothetical protein OZX67_07845 [Bifidobacterium sp. ESL0728]|uniref:hypothetical protein n=1 Tax=Bifidobacterium sp. ESL0728 TaxID=2983220 RepID=UPI0023F88A03|nr:hypothetical protein [Bifidobacterium sp. ESL0728]WEV58698.1 hypothetical protein OZX67_07845 [Bifidobacterium sp. ESL0728]